MLAVLIFLGVMMSLQVVRPKFLVNDESGDWKEFGFGENQTCFNIFVVSLTVAIFSYLVSSLITYRQ